MKKQPSHKDKGFVVEYRCQECNKLIALEKDGQIGTEIKCLRCGTINRIFENIDEQIIITDANGIIIFANNEVEKATGYSLGEIIGKKPSLWGKQMSRTFYKKLWKHLTRKKAPLSVQVINRKKDGTLYRARLRISPVLDSDQNVKFYVGIETVSPKIKTHNRQKPKSES